MMMFLYGVYNTASGEPPAQARVPAETAREALAILRKTFDGVLNADEEGEDFLQFQLLDVQEVTEPEIELTQVFVLTPNGSIWTRDI